MNVRARQIMIQGNKLQNIDYKRKGIMFFFFLFSFQFFLKAELCVCNPASDSLQLVEFRNATNGASWTNQWDTNVPMDTWFGVTLTPERCVQRLNMYVSFSAYLGNNLTGFIPDLVLPELTDLVLQGNSITGTIPDFSNLPKLSNLNLNSNNISGSFPDFSFNPVLTNIEMDGNAISGGIPDFPNSPELTSISCFFCNLSGSIPDFSNIPDLAYLYLGQNNLNGVLPDFSNIPNLRILNLNNNAIAGDILDFSNMPLLEELFLGNNNLTGDILDFQNMPLLRSLELKENAITGTIPDFSGMPLMENLHIGFNDYEGIIPNFSNMPVLQLLDISRSNLIGNIPDLMNCPLLEKLSLIGNELEGSVPDFSTFPLVTLRLQENNLTDLPDLSALNDWGDFISNGFVIHDNQLTFEDILPNMPAANSGFWKYAPQDSVGVERTEILVPGTDYIIDLEIDELITDNVYNWYKGGVFYQEIIGNNELAINNLEGTDEGTYTCIITNSGAPDLTLYSRSVTLVLCIQAIDAIASNTGAYCDNETIELNAIINTDDITEVEYQWSNDNGYTSDELAPTDATEAGIYTFIAVLDGCPSIPVNTEVEIFQTPNQPIITTVDSIVCEGESLQLSTNTEENIIYEWSGELGFISNEEDPFVSNNATTEMSGIYSLSLNNNGCISSAANVNISVLAYADADFTFDDVCEGEPVFPSNIATLGGTFSFGNTPTDGASINATTGEILNATTGASYDVNYTLNSTSECASQQTATVNIIAAPIFENVEVSCAADLLTYSISFNSTGTIITATEGELTDLGNGNWLLENISAATDVQLDASIGATLCSTILDITAPNCECPTIAAPIVDNAIYTICEGEENPILSVLVEENYLANWYTQQNGGNAIAEETLSYQPSNANTFYVETFDPITNCVSDTRTEIIFEIAEVPTIEVSSIICDTLTNSYSVAFFSNSDNITISEGELTVLLDNNYIASSVREDSDLEIFANISICETSIIVDAPNCYCEAIAELETITPTCHGDANGSIIIQKGSHYLTAVDVRLNGEIYSTNTVLPITITGLEGGFYDLVISDQTGCEKIINIELEKPEKLELDLGENIEILPGDEVNIVTQTNLLDIADLNWSDLSATLSCTDCLEPTANPLETSYYKLTLTDEFGCMVSDELRIFVNQNIPIYAPTAFSPNADGSNDFFTIFGDETKVKLIKNLQIFDRWGAQLYAQTDLLPNDENAGWAGDFRGLEMDTGVYVWFAELELFDGRIERLEGAVSLVR